MTKSLARGFLTASLCCLAASATHAQEASAPAATITEPAAMEPIGTRILNTASPFTLPKRRWELLFAHRFRGTINGGSAHDLWGLDQGSDVTLGATYGVTGKLDLSLARSSIQENFELAAKWQALSESCGAPLTAALRLGVDRLGGTGAEDPTRPFAQIPLARSFGGRVQVLAAPSWVGDTPRLRNAFNVPLGVSVEIAPHARIEVEYVPKNRDFDDSVAAWHAGIAKRVGGHVFKVFLGNTRGTTVDQILGGDSVAGARQSDLRIGFNLVRYLPH
jgi:hypothetical protein